MKLVEYVLLLQALVSKIFKIKSSDMTTPFDNNIKFTPDFSSQGRNKKFSDVN